MSSLIVSVRRESTGMKVPWSGLTKPPTAALYNCEYVLTIVPCTCIKGYIVHKHDILCIHDCNQAAIFVLDNGCNYK